MVELTRRTASLGDLKAIWDLVKESAHDMVFDVENAAAQEAMLSQIMVCCTSGLSPVALAPGGGVVGALLVRRDELEWGLRNSPAVHVAAAAVAPAQKDHGVLDALMADVLERKAPVFVSVKKGEQLGFEDLLVQRGFTHEASAESGWGDLYAWGAARPLH
jgi:hypothetical protein